MASKIAFQGSVPMNYEQYMGPFLFEPFAKNLVQRLSGKRYTYILEIACGTGRLTNHLLRLLDAMGSLFSTDLNPEMIAVAQRKISDTRIKWQAADAQNLPFESNYFDLAVCQFGVMFFPDKQQAFAEAHRVLKNGGQFVFTVWDSLNHNVHTQIINDTMKEEFGAETPMFWEQGPFSFFDKDLIRNMMEKAGFKNIQIEVVKLNSGYSSVDDVITGLLDGTPLASFLSEKSNEEREKLRAKCKEKYLAAYGERSDAVPLQAVLCEGEK